ncbi:hypothetical protein DFQ30_000727 [Apophysomyces sp. BC1015]|nr:hypothetical protein DFQ30_000727 [Apophysomyces sp. BC1015]
MLGISVSSSREVGHRVKSISASKFSGPEVVALQQGGNEIGRGIWLSNYRMSSSEPETDSDVRLFMRQKYYEQKWLDREKLKEHAESVKQMIKTMFTEDGTRRSRVSTPPLPNQPQPSTVYEQSNSYMSIKAPLQCKLPVAARHTDDDMLIGMTSAPQQILATPAQKEPIRDLLVDDMGPEQPSPNSATGSVGSRSSFPFPPASPTTSPLSPSTNAMSPRTMMTTARSSVDMSLPAASTNSFLSELAGLESPPLVNRPVYTGGVLVPNSPGAVSSVPSSFHMPVQYSNTTDQNNKRSSSIDVDPYAALRGLSLNSSPATNNNSRGGQSERARSMSMQYSTGASSNSWGNFTNTSNGHRSPQGTGAVGGVNTHLRQNSTPSASLFGDLDPLAQLKGKYDGHRG